MLFEEDNFATMPDSEVVFLMETNDATGAMLSKS
jgi:hypothetical protein